MSRDAGAGKIVIDVRGTSATPYTKPQGDTTIEAKLDGQVCGTAQVIVVVPKSICGPCEHGSSSSSSASSDPGCPDDSQRTAENLVLDPTTSPAWHQITEGTVKLVTAWVLWVTMKVCDQFDEALDELYEGCCVEERRGGTYYPINQTISDDGTYQDPVAWSESPATSVVDATSEAAQEWPGDPKLLMASAGCYRQRIPVRVCGHEIGMTDRRLCHKQPDCVWIICPDGKIIV